MSGQMSNKSKPNNGVNEAGASSAEERAEDQQ